MRLSLRINQIFGEIGLQLKDPQTSVEQRPANISLTQKPGRLSIKSQFTKVKIDQTKARADLNYKNHKIYSKEIARKGHQAALKAIAIYAQEGDQLAAIEKGGKSIVSQAIKHAYGNQKKLGLKWKQGPEYRVAPGRQNIRFKVNDLDGIDFKVKSNRPKVDFQWGKVEVYQNKQPRLEIKVVDTKI
ncbi:MULTISPECIES: DUF6470 family protein [unclassified Candidatus Frackibacter]|uniref:DUF6470 family protein n=1 Tax=unclassified Candidatus Frackibacter TaxID=2648818 RepID=UPI000886EABD|nr:MULTISPECIES: DUF6470 family protein [unclassified Candidatus Frackibacter]SDC72558.1 hypothetical protein SAMN04515661_12135 [Candidatus Frackibacter sp. WG11]SEM86827.1 hypothetical protein SAMN04488698_12135 [Candidatus Frackibacter sp. WG12]SFL95860.1 hypothetical protein SAMN04488699_12235 [Candidatus Frackibacter sp. WG13]